MARYTRLIYKLDKPQKFQLYMRPEFYIEITPQNMRKKPRWTRIPLSYLPPELSQMTDWLNDPARPGAWSLQTFHDINLDANTQTSRWRCRIRNPLFHIDHPDTAFEFKLRWYNAPPARESSNLSPS